jgi:hypothetical protein
VTSELRAEVDAELLGEALATLRNDIGWLRNEAIFTRRAVEDLGHMLTGIRDGIRALAVEARRTVQVDIKEG